MKLNIFQRGILQKLVTVLTYFVCIILGALFLDWLNKRLFIAAARDAHQQGSLSLGEFGNFVTLIKSQDISAVFAIILVVLTCVAICWFLMRLVASLNWSLPVTLPKAVEFRSAMRKLGIVAPNEQIEFAKKYKLSVFIATSTLIEEERTDVRARLYTFASHSLLSEESVFERYIGKQTLCLNADDYEQIAESARRNSSLEECIALTEKDETIKALRSTLKAAEQENDELRSDRDSLRNKVRIQPAHEDSRVERLRVEHLLWAAYLPVMERLMSEAPEGKRYTTPEIEDALNNEWVHRADLRERMKLLTGSEYANPSETFIKAIKAEFKAQGKLSSGGRPRKTA